MLQILEKIAEKSRWNLTCFQGRLHLSGRILSPIEAQAAGIASKSIMMKMYQAMMESEEKELSKEEQETEILKKLNSLKADDLLNFGQMQDRVVCQVVDKASEDGEEYERITFVTNEQQQNPARHHLWVGLLSQEDKNAIFEAAMQSVKEATVGVESFRE